MSDKRLKVETDRRSFLKLAGAGAVTGGAALATSAAGAVAEETGERDNKLYRETDHVKRVYELSRF